jgi:hypothetical protein
VVGLGLLVLPYQFYLWYGACSSIVGGGTTLQNQKVTGSISDEVIGFFFN